MEPRYVAGVAGSSFWVIKDKWPALEPSIAFFVFLTM